MIEIQPEHIQYLEVGDTFYETGYGHKIDLRVIEKPTYNATECNWTWKAIDLDTYKVIDYLVKDSGACYIHIYFTEETYKRIQNSKIKEESQKLVSSLYGGSATLTLSKENFYETIKNARVKMGDKGYEFKVNTKSMGLKGKKWDKAWIDENIPF